MAKTNNAASVEQDLKDTRAHAFDIEMALSRMAQINHSAIDSLDCSDHNKLVDTLDAFLDAQQKYIREITAVNHKILEGLAKIETVINLDLA